MVAEGMCHLFQMGAWGSGLDAETLDIQLRAWVAFGGDGLLYGPEQLPISL